MKNTWRFDETEMEYIREVIESDFVSSTSGNMNRRFENAFAEKVGAKYAVTFNSGTSTMHACLAAANVGPGDEVIVPALTVISTASVVLHQNAVPIFADIDENTFNIDPEDVNRKITPRTKAIIPVSLYGLSADLDPIMELAHQHNLTVIEDNAQAHLAKYKNKTVGTIGHMSSFSFENSKHITTGDGGIVTTNVESFAIRVRKFASLGYAGLEAKDGRIRKLKKDELQDPNYERHDSFGWNYRMPEVAAAIGMGQIKKIDKFVHNRIEIAKLYKSVIDETECDYLIPQYNPEGYVNTYYTFACIFEENMAGASWKEFRKKYIEFGGDGIYAAWKVVYLEPVMKNYRFYGKECPHRCPHYKGQVKYEQGLCPIAEKIQPKLMQFVNNYKDVNEAKPKVDALRKTINYFRG